MRTVAEIIKDGDWCISRTVHSYLISVEDWQTLKAAVLAQQTNNSRVMPCPAFLPLARCGMFNGERCPEGRSCLISRAQA
jgi:hypothetical protein